MGDHRDSIAHFESMARVLRDLRSDGIDLSEHQFHPHAFGSFVAVLGRGHEYVKFSWDGREFVLSIYTCTVPDSSATTRWTHDADVSLPNGDGLYEEIASEAVQVLAI